MNELRTDQLDYHLPSELIAQEPLPRRDQSRLLVFHRSSGEIEHRKFSDLPEYLSAGDALILNTTRVIKARLLGRRSTGGRVEFLLLEPTGSHRWNVLCRPAARLRTGERVQLEGEFAGIIRSLGEGGIAEVEFNGDRDTKGALDRIGHVPLPPYIDRADRPDDELRYQTVYARQPGAVAAPTAGLHFTPELLARIEAAGIRRGELVLHVGPGTFKPITAEHVRDHMIDAERVHVPAAVRSLVDGTHQHGGRVIAVGTTCVRALEAAARHPDDRADFESRVGLVIMPPFEFRAVDALITNFHLPRSSLLALVAAFAGLQRILDVYRVAVQERYRFYSYGDAMVIL